VERQGLVVEVERQSLVVEVERQGLVVEVEAVQSVGNLKTHFKIKPCSPYRISGLVLLEAAVRVRNITGLTCGLASDLLVSWITHLALVVSR